MIVPSDILCSPRTYEYAIYPLERQVTTVFAQFFISEFEKQIQLKDENEPVPVEGLSLTLPYDLVELEILVVGDKNLIWFNVAQCVQRMAKVYETKAADVPFLQCGIHEDNYLQGKVQTVLASLPPGACLKPFPSVA